MPLLPRSKKKWVMVVVAGAVALVGWWQADAFWAWYSARQLAAADDSHREAWVQRVVALDAVAVPRLLDHLAEADKQRCRNVGVALGTLAQNWGADDPRGGALLKELARRFGDFSAQGQVETLRVGAALLAGKGKEQPLAGAVTQEVGTLLTAAAKIEGLRQPVLTLASALLERVPEGQWRDWSRNLALAGLMDPSGATRLAAVQLMLREPFRKDPELMAQLVPFLKDESAGVRKACLVALGSARDLIGDDDLLPLLHDPEPEVQAMCEIALRSRGLSDLQIEMARLISDPRPSARLRVLHYLHGDSDVEPGVWLRRLSQDVAPAVRAAAVRAASAQTRVDLRDRLGDMAIQDPSPTVRELAGHYLGWHEKRLKDMRDE